MYTYKEIYLIFSRCKSNEELEKICDGFIVLVKQGALCDALAMMVGQLSHHQFVKINGFEP
jgi:hypothetical protein